jgi:hypothetical protein
VAIDTAFCAEGCRARVDSSIALLAPRVDHLPVAVQFWAMLAGSSANSVRAAPACCDVSQFDDETKAAAFAQLLNSFGDAGDLDVEQHLA